MITENNKRLEFENLQDAMKTAKTLLKNGYQVYMNIEDDLGDGKIIVVIEYEWLDEELADGHYIYQTFEDEARIEAEIRQKKDKETNEDYIWGHEEGYQAGWTAGYNARLGEETCDDDEDDGQKKVDKESEDYLAGHAEGFQAGWTCGYERRREEEANTEEITENYEDDDDADEDDDNYSSWSEEHRKWFDAGYDEGYTTAKYDFCDCPEDD